VAKGRLIYGFHAVAARLKQRPESVREIHLDPSRDDPRVRGLLASAKSTEVKVVHSAAHRLDQMLPGVRHQGVACMVDADDRTLDLEDLLDALDEPALILALDGVQDPHNLGACLRSADAMGAHAVIAPKDRAVGITPVVEKVASGAVENVPYLMVTNLARSLEILQDRGVSVVGLAGEGDAELPGADLKGAVALVLGAEGAGLRRLTRERCDTIVRIPMFGSVESLNVSVAAGICLYEARRQRPK